MNVFFDCVDHLCIVSKMKSVLCSVASFNFSCLFSLSNFLICFSLELSYCCTSWSFVLTLCVPRNFKKFCCPHVIFHVRVYTFRLWRAHEIEKPFCESSVRPPYNAKMEYMLCQWCFLRQELPWSSFKVTVILLYVCQCCFIMLGSSNDYPLFTNHTVVYSMPNTCFWTCSCFCSGYISFSVFQRVTNIMYFCF